MRNPALCICKNKDADQLRRNREADQRLCFRYTDSTITLLPKSEISSLQPSSVSAQPGLCRTRSETPKTGFLTTRLIYELQKERKYMSYIDSLILLAHRSRRLTGELIGYPWIRHLSVRPSSVRPFTFSNISSETTWPIKAKFYVEPPWERETKVCINGPGHMTKMAAMPIYGKNLKKSSSPEPEVL